MEKLLRIVTNGKHKMLVVNTRFPSVSPFVDIVALFEYVLRRMLKNGFHSSGQ